MPEANKIIHLAIAFDQNYLAAFYALATSIFENNRQNKLAIHAIVTGISAFEKQAISGFTGKHNCEIFFYEINEKITSQLVLTGKWTQAVYYRLFFPLLVPANLERLLYLDTDTLVINDLKELYETDLDPYPVGAVYDNYVKKAPYLNIHQEGNYFNSGVLLIDLPKWKNQQISETAVAFLQDNPDKIRFVDQDALNAVLLNNWKKLSVKFNFMYSLIPEGISRKQLNKLIEDKVVVHFTLQRPWHLLCKNRLRVLYFYYLKRSPFKNKRGIVDFQFKMIPSLLRIRATEFYFDSPIFQGIWRKVKK